MALERLQKILARAGVTSRRQAEALIVAGRVRVDGKVVTELGTRADPRRSKVELDGKRLVAEDLVYGVMHKARGVMSTLRDPEGRPTVGEVLRRVGARVVPVGRLDYHTSGALLFTNDGDFAAKLQHARSNVPKVYVAKVRGSLDERHIARWCESIEIDGKMTRPAELRVLRDEGDKTWIEVTLREGKNRQIRRLGEHAGTPVMRLARVSQAGIDVEKLRPGQWRYLTVDELTSLKRTFGVPKRVRPAPQKPGGTSQRVGASGRSAGTKPAGRPTAGGGRAGSGRAQKGGASARPGRASGRSAGTKPSGRSTAGGGRAASGRTAGARRAAEQAPARRPSGRKSGRRT